MRHNIIAYTICYNESKIFPFFIKYIMNFASKVIVYDNESDDGILDEFKKYDNIEVRTFSTAGKISDEVIQGIKNDCWKESIGKCDYVYVGEFDEYLWSPDLDKELDYMDKNDMTIVWPDIYDLYCENFPKYNNKKFLHQYDNMKFYRNCDFGKRILFNPNKITSLVHGAGGHTCLPCGDIKYYDGNKIFMFHGKNMGPQYLYDRYLMYHKRFKPTIREKILGVNSHLLNVEKDKIFNNFKNIFDKSHEINYFDTIMQSEKIHETS